MEVSRFDDADYALARDASRNSIERRWAFERYEVRCWADALQGANSLRLESLDPAIRMSVARELITRERTQTGPLALTTTLGATP